MSIGFPPVPSYPTGIDSDRTLFLVYNTTETTLAANNPAWSEEILITPAEGPEIWADNGFATIEGELLYYDDVDKIDGKVYKLKRCCRNIGGRPTQFNSVGTWIRGFVVAEHHNQLASVILNIEEFVGENFSDDTSTLDWRIRNLQDEPLIFDDFACPDIEFNFIVVEENPNTGTLARFLVNLNGGFGSVEIQFGDGTSTTQLSGTHQYAPNANIDPVVIVSNGDCQVVQTPIERDRTSEPTVRARTQPFSVPIPVNPVFPSLVFPTQTIPTIDINIPPIVFPHLDLSPSFSLPSVISFVPQINLPSIISFTPVLNFPSVITFVPSIQIPSTISFLNVPSFNPIGFVDVPSFSPIGFAEAPSFVIATFGPAPSFGPIGFGPAPNFTFPSLIEFGPAPNFTLPSLIEFGPGPNIPSMINFGPGGNIPSLIEFGPGPNIPSLVNFGPAPNISLPSLINFGPAPSISLPSMISFGPAPTFPSMIEFGPGGNIPSMISFGPSPNIPTLIEFGPAPTFPSLITFGPGPNIPTLINFGAAPSFANINFGPAPSFTTIEFGPTPSFTTIEFGPAPSFPSRIEFGPGGNIPTLIDFGPAPSFASIEFGPAPSFTTIEFGPAPSFTTIEFGPAPNVSVVWGTPPSITCTCQVVCPSSSPMAMARPAAAFTEFSDPSFDAMEIQYDMVGFPTEIKIVSPEIPPIKIEHDIPTFINVVVPEEINITGVSIPSEIRIIPPDMSDIINIISFSLPSKIELDVSKLPEAISVVFPKEMPVITFDTRGIPESIRVIGIPETIKIEHSIPSVIGIELPKDYKLPLVFDGPPIQGELKVNWGALDKFIAEDDGLPCFKFVPCRNS